MEKPIFIIKKPLITEKATRLGDAGQYIFRVEDSATKNEIKKAIKETYKVEVSKVNVINTEGKSKRYRNIRKKKSGFRKAIVVLKPGQKINITP